MGSLARVLVCAAAVVLLAAPAAVARPAYRGVQLHSLWFDTSRAQMDRELAAAHALGSTAVRVDVVWASLETDGKGRRSAWYVRKLDRFVAGARARRMKVIATLWGTPCWAAAAPAAVKQGCAGDWWNRGVDAYPPARPRDYAAVARWVTARYGRDLAALEIWNEPDLPDRSFWNTDDAPGRYAALLRAAYPAAKKGDPRVPVLAGAMAGNDLPFLRALYAHGARGRYDGVSVHPYAAERGPDDPGDPGFERYTFALGLGWLRAGMAAAGDRAPLWVTEFGWTTASPGGVTEQQQADYLTRGFAVLDGLRFVRAGIVYNLRDKGGDPAVREDNFGLVRPDFSAKPAYGAVADALRGARTVK